MSSESAQVYKEQIPATTQNVRNDLTPRMHLVNQHSGDYAWVTIWAQLGAMIGPLISGAVI